MKGRLRLAGILAAVALLAGCVAPRVSHAPSPAATISQAALSARQATGDATLVVLDVRTPEEYAAGHVPGAVNIPHDQVEARLGHLEGDMQAWSESGRPVEKAAERLPQPAML